MRMPAWVSRLRAFSQRVPDEGLATFLGAAGTLVLAGFSLALALCQLDERFGTAFIAANTLTRELRLRLLAVMGGGAAAGLLLAIGLVWIRPAPDRLARAARAGRLAAPLVLAGAVPALLRPSAWSDLLTFCLLGSAFVIALEALLRHHFAAYAPARGAVGQRLEALAARIRAALPRLVRGRGPAIAIGLMTAGYAAYMGYWVLEKHFTFQTYTWDLGQFDNFAYNALEGHPFRCTALSREGDWSDLKNHAHFGMYALLPFYALHPASETLLLLQMLIVASGGVALYRFAARRLPPWVALALAAAYYLYPPLHGGVFFDIHFQVVAVGFVLWAIDCFDARRMGWFALFLLLALSCREDVPIGTATFGLFAALYWKRVRAGLLTFGVSTLYFVLIRFVIMPAVGTWHFSDLYKGLYPEGARGFGGVILTLITNPLFALKTVLTAEKLRYFLQIVAPLAFLPLRRPLLWLGMVTGLLCTVMTTGYPSTIDIAFQYAAHFVPYCFPAAALALESLAQRPDGGAARRAATGSLIAATVLFTTHWGAIPPRENFRSAYKVVRFESRTPEHVRRRAALLELDAMVPKDAILAVTDNELPHVSNRTECWILAAGFEGSDYIIYPKVNHLPQERDQYKAALRAGYEKVAEREDLVLLRRPGAPKP